jgi:hypothetical protein
MNAYTLIFFGILILMPPPYRAGAKTAMAEAGIPVRQNGS